MPACAEPSTGVLRVGVGRIRIVCDGTACMYDHRHLQGEARPPTRAPPQAGWGHVLTEKEQEIWQEGQVVDDATIDRWFEEDVPEPEFDDDEFGPNFSFYVQRDENGDLWAGMKHKLTEEEQKVPALGPCPCPGLPLPSSPCCWACGAPQGTGH